MGNKMKKKGSSGAAKNFITRTQAIRRLQLSLKDFRRLCILKGIYPVEPKKKTHLGVGQHKTYYLLKDIQFLGQEKIINNFREFRHFMRRMRHALNKKDREAYKRIGSNHSTYRLDHIVRERVVNDNVHKILARYGHVSYKQGVSVAVNRYICHVGFKLEGFCNDICIMLLPEDIQMSRSVGTVCLPIPPLDPTGLKATVSAWGTTNHKAAVPVGSDVLMYTNVIIQKQSTCKSHSTVGNGFKPNMHICAYQDNTDACQGDSGGPLMVKLSGRWILVGLVSYGYQCNVRDTPGVYTNINNYIDWIKKTIGTAHSKYTKVQS